MALARLQLLKSPAFLNLVETLYDEALKSLLIIATNFAESYTARTLERSGNTPDRLAYFTGRNERKLYLDEYPVPSITLVEIWDGDTWVTIDSSHYELRGERTLVYPIRTKAGDSEYGSWPSNTDEGIRVTFPAGYLTDQWELLNTWSPFAVPADLENAICELAMKDWKDSEGGDNRFMMASISRGAESIAVDKFLKGIPEAAQLALDRYTDPHV